MEELALEIILAGSYENLTSEIKRQIADVVPPDVLKRDTNAILIYLGARKKPTPHYIFIC